MVSKNSLEKGFNMWLKNYSVPPEKDQQYYLKLAFVAGMRWQKAEDISMTEDQRELEFKAEKIEQNSKILENKNE